MRAAARTRLTAILALALLQPAGAQASQSDRARRITEILASTRCNLATAYRLAQQERLKVRVRPSENSPVVARLEEGRIVYVCDESGDWLNIYFGGTEGPCFRTYEGGLKYPEAHKCKSGWVRQKWVNILSG